MFIMFWFFPVFAYLRSVTDTTQCCANEWIQERMSGERLETNNKEEEAADIMEEKRDSMEINLKTVDEK